jgi:hypothetical protein
MLLDGFNHWHHFNFSLNVLVFSRMNILMGNLGDKGYGLFNHLLYYFLALWGTHKTKK